MPADSEPADDAVAQVTDPTDPPLPTWDDAVQQAGGMPTPIVPDGVQFAEPVPGYPQSTQPGAPQNQTPPQHQIDPALQPAPPPLPNHLPEPDHSTETINHGETPQTHALNDDVIEASDAHVVVADGVHDVAEGEPFPTDSGGMFQPVVDFMRTANSDAEARQVLTEVDRELGQAMHHMADGVHNLADTMSTVIEAQGEHDVHDATPADVHDASAEHDPYDHHDVDE